MKMNPMNVFPSTLPLQIHTPPICMVRAYAEFEKRVRLTMAGICAPFCRTCKKPCCRVEFCEETLTSPWLVLVQTFFPPNSRYHPCRGWYSSDGCTLSVGRAPVCYEYFCSRILTGYDERRDYALRALGKLVTFVGQNALGGTHLVALPRGEDLLRLKPKRFQRRIQTASVALKACCKVLERNEAAPQDLTPLARIQELRRF